MAKTNRIFASLDDYLNPSAGVNRVGRNMANYFFFKALLKYGTFDEYHFFLANRAHRKMFEQHHEQFFKKAGISKKIKLFDRVDLPDALLQNDYTVFHQSDHVTHFGNLCRLRNRVGASFPVTAFIHSISYQTYMGRYLELTQGGVTKNDAILCSSNCGKKVIENCFDSLTTGLNVDKLKARLEVVPLGIDEQAYTKDIDAVRKQLGFAGDEVVALCFGRFSDFDKMDLFPLLQAFRRILNPAKKWRLILAGAVHDAEYYQILELWIKALGLSQNVAIVIDPSDEKKTDLYHAADFFVSVADNPQETFGLTLLESMSAATPMVVSEFNGYRELCSDEAGIRVPTIWTGFEHMDIVEPIMDQRTFHKMAAQCVVVDTGRLATALKRMFCNKNLRKQKGAAAKQRFENMYSHKVIIKQLESLWDELKSDFKVQKTATDPLAIKMFSSFSHYVTRQISSDELVQTTAFAKQLLGSNANYPVLSGMSDIIDSEHVKKAMKAAHSPIKVSDMWNTESLKWRQKYLIMWMLKHDLLEICEH